MKKKKIIKTTPIENIKNKSIQLKEDIATFRLFGVAISKQKKKHAELEEKIKDDTRQLKKMQKLAEQYQEIYAGLEELRKLDSLPISKKEKRTVEILKKEIQRLQELNTTQRELLKNHSVTNPIATIEIPERKLSVNPITFIQQLKQHRKEKKEFKELVRKVRTSEINFTLNKNDTEVEIRNNGTRGYKAENAINHKSYFKVGESKYFATYYLSDLPRILYPDAIYKLMSSSLPFSVSMFITPLNNASLIKQIRSRLATLYLWQRGADG